MKISEEGGWGGVPGAEVEIPLEPAHGEDHGDTSCPPVAHGGLH